MPWRVTVVDDRGRRVPLAPSEIVPTGASSDRSARMARAARSREPTTRAEIVRGVLFGLAALPVMLVAALAPVWIAIRTGWPWWLKILSGLPMGILPALITIFMVRRVAPQRLARQHVRAGYCGSCAHDLTGLSREGDGCRVCSECGAAWR